MSEFEQTTPEEPAVDSFDKNTATETGLVLVDRDKTLEKGDVDTLQQKAGELQGIIEIQRALEGSIIGAGLQIMADRYGADKLLDAMQGGFTFRKVIEKLAPEREERDALYESIRAEPIDALAERFNDTLGGVSAFSAETHDGIARRRHYESQTIEGRVPIYGSTRLFARRINKEGDTQSAELLHNVNLKDLLEKHSALVESFRETNDTLALLSGIRAIYETEYTQFSSDLERAKGIVEKKIASAEASIAELQSITDDIYADEIARLEERLAATSGEEARAMMQDMLDKKANEIGTTHEEFRSRIETIRSEIISGLGAARLSQLRVAPPIKTRPTFKYEEQPVNS